MNKKLFYFPVILFFLITGCSHTSQIYINESAGETAAKYTAIYYVHADSDYLFHQSDGSPSQANEVALDKAIDVAKAARSGEVFIFHQKPERKRFGLFPRRQSEFYHYRNGTLLNHIKYRYTDENDSLLIAESNFYHTYHSRLHTSDHQAYFFYFGHEVPKDHDQKYHKSLPQIPVTIDTFASGLQGFLAPGQSYDLVVISTCDNATSSMARHLVPFSRYLLASPQNLHLSYMDIDAMSLLEATQVPAVHDIALQMASNTFDRLSNDIHTAVTLTVFELAMVSEYIEAFDDRVSAFEESTNADPYRENIDCAELPFFKPDIYLKGVSSFYRPAKFGVKSASGVHSGWGCKGI